MNSLYIDRKQIISIVSVILSGLVLIIGSTSNASENMIPNGSFEDWNGLVPEAWKAEGDQDAFVKEAGSVFAGRYSLKISGGSRHGRLISKPVPCKAGSYLALSAWGKLYGDVVSLRFYGRGKIKDFLLRHVDGTLPYGWALHAYSPVHVPEEMDSVSIVIDGNKNFSEKQFIDNLALWTVPKPENDFEASIRPMRIDLLDWAFVELPSRGIEHPCTLAPNHFINTVFLEILSDKTGNIFFKGEDELKINFRVFNFVGINQDVTVQFKIQGWDGTPGPESSFEINVKPFVTATKTLVLPIDRVGHYTIYAKAKINGRTVGRFEGRFALSNKLSRKDVPAKDSPFGGATGTMGYMPRTKAVIAIAKLLGVKNRRQQVYQAEPNTTAYKKGDYYRWAYLSVPEVVKLYRQAGIETFLNAGWYLSADYKAYAKVTKAVVSKNADQYQFFSPMCEPDQFLQQGYNENEFFENIKTAYLASKEVKPNFEVYSTSWAGHLEKFRDSYKWGIAPYQDGVVMHCYNEDYDKVAEFYKVMREFGDGNKKIIIGESGLGAVVQSHAPPEVRRIQEAIQAGSVVRWYTRLLSEQPYVKQIHWFTIYNEIQRESFYDGLGLVMPETIQPRPGAIAYMVLTDKLGLAPKPQCYDIKDRIRAYIFESPSGSRIVVVWNDGPRAEVEFSSDADTVTVSDIMGRVEKKHKVVVGKFNLVLDRTPIYIEGIKTLAVNKATVICGDKTKQETLPAKFANSPSEAVNISRMPGISDQALSYKEGLKLRYPMYGRFDPFKGTVQFWVKIEANSALPPMPAIQLFYMDSGSNWAASEMAPVMGTYIKSDQIHIILRYGRVSGGANDVIIHLKESILGNWHNIAFTWDYWAGLCKVYLDGKLVTQAEIVVNYPPVPTSKSAELRINGLSKEGVMKKCIDECGLKLGLDDLIFYNYPKTDKEILQDYDSGIKKKPISTDGVLFMDKEHI